MLKYDVKKLEGGYTDVGFISLYNILMKYFII